MSALARRSVALLALALACVLPLGSAQAGGSTDNIATAITEQDGSQAFDFAWDVSRQRSDDPVDNLNEARARARCVHCGATAIAFQIVLVSGSPRTVMPRNLAEAINYECTQCQVVAEARQFVRVVPDPVRFTHDGRATLANVRKKLRSLESRDLSIDELHQTVERQEARVREVLRDELVLKSDPDTEVDFLRKRTLQAADSD